MVKLYKQCIVELADEPGALERLTGRVAEAGINIMAMASWRRHGVRYVMLVTQDHDEVCTAISPYVDRCEFREVVCVEMPNKPGAMNDIAGKLKDAGIEIDNVYVTGGRAKQAMAVFDAVDSQTALEVLGKKE